MGQEQSGLTAPGKYSNDGDGFPWHQLPRKAKVGMMSSQYLAAARVEIGMGSCILTVARSLNVSSFGFLARSRGRMMAGLVALKG